MMEKTENQYYIPVLITSLKDCFKDIPFDIYLKLSDDKYVKAFDHKTGIDFSRLAHYESKNVEYFYVRNEHEEELKYFFSNSPMMILTDSKAPMSEKKKAFWSSIEQSLSESIVMVNLSHLSIQKTFTALQTILEQGHDFGKTLQTLIQHTAKKDVFYKHAITTAIYCYLITLTTNMRSPRTQKILVFASLFHDIGKLKLPEGLRIRNQNKTTEEIENFEKHPQFTLEMIPETLPNSDAEIRKCILEHKERHDGTGYPNKVKGVNIYSLAKILAIADSLSELTLGLEDGKAYSLEQALSIMKNHSGRFDQHLLNKFIATIYSKSSNAA